MDNIESDCTVRAPTLGVNSMSENPSGHFCSSDVFIRRLDGTLMAAAAEDGQFEN